jgi:cytochrome c oxidase subunit 1
MKEKPEIHLPGPSYWPIALAFSMVLISIGVVSNFIVSILGVIGLLVSIAGWTLENRAEDQEEEHHE